MHIIEAVEVVGVFEFSPIYAGEDAESFKFRVEVLRDMSKRRSYFARIYRRETFRVRPTFPIPKFRHNRPALADHEILVLDDMVGCDDFRASSKLSVLKKVKRRFEEIFDAKGYHP